MSKFPLRYELNIYVLLRRTLVLRLSRVGSNTSASPASRRRRRKGNTVPGGITGPPYAWGI
jgi:hypothetical protein